MSDLFTPDQDQRSQQADRPDPDTDPEAPLEAAREGLEFVLETDPHDEAA